MFLCALTSPFYQWKNVAYYLKLPVEFIDCKWIHVEKEVVQLSSTVKEVEHFFKRYLRKPHVFHHFSF